MSVLLAIDQGTTGTTCAVVDESLSVLGRGYARIAQRFPRPGWVEHDPEELWTSVEEAAAKALADAGVGLGDTAAVGIANQRETTVLWERRSGRPVAPAIVWQDRRTAERSAELPRDLVRERTGLVPDPYFSATKLAWLLEGRDADGLAFGTVDSWLLWKLTDGRVHATDVSNASRTLLFDVHRLIWDEDLLELFGVPRDVLPEVVSSSAAIAEGRLLEAPVSVCGIAGDQQAALFGQACFEPGTAKATFGTGTFVLEHTGADDGAPVDGLLRTVAWRLGDGPATYALEGSIFTTGAALEWLRDALGLLEAADESEALARSVPDNAGVYFVPALAGLGSPHWQPDARGALVGLTQASRREHVVRAALEAIAYQVADVLGAMGGGARVLRADGGGAANGFVLQRLADAAQVPVEVSRERETTALGAAALAGLAAGIWTSTDELAAAWRPGARYEPEMEPAAVEQLLSEWRRALRSTLP